MCKDLGPLVCEEAREKLSKEVGFAKKFKEVAEDWLRARGSRSIHDQGRSGSTIRAEICDVFLFCCI